MFNKILVPLDGSDLAERALEPAFALGQQAEGEVLLLRVSVLERILVPDTHLYGGYGVIWPNQSLELSHSEAEDYLQFIQKHKAPRHLSVRMQVADGGVAESIMDTAAAEKTDLIVMSSHGYSGVTRWVLGSVAEKVLHSASYPVLVIRSPQALRRILIPLDGSPLAEQALEPGLEVAAGLRGEVTLLRAIPRVEVKEIERLDELERGLGRRLEDEIHDDADRYLRGLVETHGRPRLAIQTALVDEPAADSILRFAETHAVDLIVMSTHGRTGLQRWVYGSVTEKVLRGASHSMLVICPTAQDLR